MMRGGREIHLVLDTLEIITNNTTLKSMQAVSQLLI